MLIVQYIEALPIVYRTVLTLPNLVLVNIMACRVFRHLKLGDFIDASTEVSRSSVRVDHREDHRGNSDIFVVPFASGQHLSKIDDSPKMNVVISAERIMKQHQDGSAGKDEEKEHR